TVVQPAASAAAPSTAPRRPKRRMPAGGGTEGRVCVMMFVLWAKNGKLYTLWAVWPGGVTGFCRAYQLAVPCSLAELYRNLLMSSSSTTALCVNWISLPWARFLSSPPGVRPMYCSPSRPDVRMDAEESDGNW